MDGCTTDTSASGQSPAPDRVRLTAPPSKKDKAAGIVETQRRQAGWLAAGWVALGLLLIGKGGATSRAEWSFWLVAEAGACLAAAGLSAWRARPVSKDEKERRVAALLRSARPCPECEAPVLADDWRCPSCGSLRHQLRSGADVWLAAGLCILLPAVLWLVLTLW